MGFADGDWFVATVMEGMDEEQELDPLDLILCARKSNKDKLLSTETIKPVLQLEICVFKHCTLEKYDYCRYYLGSLSQKEGNLIVGTHLNML